MAVVIPIYRDLFITDNINIKYEYLSLLNNCTKFKNRDIYLVLPKSKSVNFKIVNVIRNKFKRVYCVYFDDRYFSSISGYNELMVQRCFYKYFKRYQYIFICQTDVWILRDNLDYYSSLNYSYIGGVYFESNNDHELLLPINGGASLRHVKSHYNLLSPFSPWGGWSFFLEGFKTINLFNLILDIKSFCYNLTYKKTRRLILNINEDIFFYRLSQISRYYNIPQIDFFNKVELFSWDTNPSILFDRINELPMAAHAWFRDDGPYLGNNKFWESIIKFDDLTDL